MKCIDNRPARSWEIVRISVRYFAEGIPLPKISKFMNQSEISGESSKWIAILCADSSLSKLLGGNRQRTDSSKVTKCRSLPFNKIDDLLPRPLTRVLEIERLVRLVMLEAERLVMFWIRKRSGLQVLERSNGETSSSQRYNLRLKFLTVAQS